MHKPLYKSVQSDKLIVYLRVLTSKLSEASRLPVKSRTNRITVSIALENLENKDTTFKAPLKSGRRIIETYKPKETDLHNNHDRDVTFIVATGPGYFLNGKYRKRTEQGKVLIVPTGVVYCFENFTKNFLTWGLFYSSVSGESYKKHLYLRSETSTSET